MATIAFTHFIPETFAMTGINSLRPDDQYTWGTV